MRLRSACKQDCKRKSEFPLNFHRPLTTDFLVYLYLEKFFLFCCYFRSLFNPYKCYSCRKIRTSEPIGILQNWLIQTSRNIWQGRGVCLRPFAIWNYFLYLKLNCNMHESVASNPNQNFFGASSGHCWIPDILIMCTSHLILMCYWLGYMIFSSFGRGVRVKSMMDENKISNSLAWQRDRKYLFLIFLNSKRGVNSAAQLRVKEREENEVGSYLALLSVAIVASCSVLCWQQHTLLPTFWHGCWMGGWLQYLPELPPSLFT